MQLIQKEQNKFIQLYIIFWIAVRLDLVAKLSNNSQSPDYWSPYLFDTQLGVAGIQAPVPRVSRQPDNHAHLQLFCELISESHNMEKW